MSPLPPLDEIRAPHAPAVVILGNDAQLAARPATPVQLAHACLAAGFRAVVPGSWGDELVAGATLTALSDRAHRPAIHCACPHVARRVLAVGSELAPHLVSLVAPPVAAARYLRHHAAGPLRVTYVGRCPAAADDSIDARLTPEELLAQIADRGIDLMSQPEVFESVIPPDRRRHLSLPGGLPTPEVLWTRTRADAATIGSGEFAAELADLVLAGSDAVIDCAPLVGCACAGAVRGAPADARLAVMALEPPRSTQPIVDPSDELHLELPLPLAARTTADLVADAQPPAALDDERILDGPVDALGSSPPPPPVAPNRRPRLTPPGIAAVTPPPAPGTTPGTAPRRRPSPITPRVVPGSVPISSDSEGRILPRAYVARRRSPRSGIPAVSEPPEPARQPALGAAAPPMTSAPSMLAAPVATSAQAAGGSAPAVIPGVARSEAPRHTITPHLPEPLQASSDSERPMERSVEPAAPRVAMAVAPPPVATPAAATAPAAGAGGVGGVGGVGGAGGAAGVAAVPTVGAVTPFAPPARPTPVGSPPRARLDAVGATLTTGAMGGAAFLRRHSRVVIAVVLTAGGVLLGVAIGYSAAHRGSAPAQAAAVPASDTVDSGSSIVRESVSAGGLAPSPASTRRRGPRTAPRGQPVAPLRRTTPTGPSPAARRDAPPVTEPAVTANDVTPAVTRPPAPVGAADSSAARAQRDSAASAGALAAERESIRREIQLRRARVDSIERARLRLDSLRRAGPAGTPPAER